MANVGRLLVLLAVLIMPFGMSAAAAAPHPAPIAGMPIEHCPDPGSRHEGKGSYAECTMACAAALPAADLRSGELPLIAFAMIMPAAQQVLRGLYPETATPPPRRS